MAIALFTDFGANDLYAGQVELALDRFAPGVRVVHLLNDAPGFDIESAAHLLAALVTRVPRGHIVLGVVDPGVGSTRSGVVVRAAGRWFVGPDNGLFAVAAVRAGSSSCWRIADPPADAAPTFHGRDVFAPMAAAIATDDFPNERATAAAGLAVQTGGGDLARIVYVDHYGNAFTGLRAGGADSSMRLVANGRAIGHARIFADVPAGDAFWYENSIGLVEIAVNRGSAARELGLAVGQAVRWED